MLQVTVRKFKKSDTELIKRITVLTFESVSIDFAMEKMFGKIGNTTWAERKLMVVENELRNNPSDVFVAVIDNKVVGYITTSLNRKTKIGFIHNLAVDPCQQGKGIGKKLIKKAINHFRQQKMEVAKIETLSHNIRGETLYKKLGFKEIVRQIHLAMSLVGK